MALGSCLVSFAFSKWNSEINDESKLVSLYQTHLIDKEPNSDSFKCILFSPDYISLSDSTEISDEFETNCASGTVVRIRYFLFGS